ncbi:hypothetical protein M758_UG219200 [Ceratodon purpureus]|nr:hypothetical protein M758_UG219200 [Ceratodon purpureus]
MFMRSLRGFSSVRMSAVGLEETISMTRIFCTLFVLYKSYACLTGLTPWMEIKLLGDS